MVKANMTERFFNLVVPLTHKVTAMRIADTSQLCLDWSGAVTPLIGESLRQGDVDSTNKRSTPTTPTMPGIRTSTTATRTTTTSRPAAVRAPRRPQINPRASMLIFPLPNW
jgi:RNA-directed DNA polymerase